MDLNYATIIKYLSENKNGIDFPIKKNIMRYSNYFENSFSNILSDDFYMYGIQVYDNSQNNISLWSSILYLVENKFLLMDKDQQISFVSLIKKQFIEFIKKNYKNFINKMKFSRNFSMDILIKNEYNPILLELISFCLDLNIIILNFETYKINIVNSQDIFNPWKSTIILGKNKEFWQPICNKNSKIFNYSNTNLKNILNMEVIYFENEYLDRDFTLVDNLNELYDENRYNKKEDNSDSDSNSMFIKKSINLNKTKLNKMKKQEIINLIEEYNYNIDIKQNKKYLINQILMC